MFRPIISSYPDVILRQSVVALIGYHEHICILSVPFLSTIRLQYLSLSMQVHPLGGGALPDINDAVGVPYDPSAGLKP